MAFFDDMTEQEIRQNKAIRGYIVRALAKGNQNSLLVRQVTNALLADNLITVPDISKQLSYLEDGGYIEFTDRRATAYNAYRRDAVIQLTKAGVPVRFVTIPGGLHGGDTEAKGFDQALAFLVERLKP